MRFTITVDPQNKIPVLQDLRWGVHNAGEALEQAENLVARGIRGVKVTTENGQSFEVSEIRQLIRRQMMQNRDVSSKSPVVDRASGAGRLSECDDGGHYAPAGLADRT